LLGRQIARLLAGAEKKSNWSAAKSKPESACLALTPVNLAPFQPVANSNRADWVISQNAASSGGQPDKCPTPDGFSHFFARDSVESLSGIFFSRAAISRGAAGSDRERIRMAGHVT
jgi:hypothetical protein